MKQILFLTGLMCFCSSAQAAAAPLTGFPFMDESLAYSINLPTGASLGMAHLTSRHTAAGWDFEFNVSAGVAGFAVRDIYKSEANSDFCSMEFSRDFSHGARKGTEKETIDRSQETVSRATTTHAGDGKSEFAIPECLKDALTLLFYTRRELGQGRVPPAQQMLFGGLYQVRLDYTGAETIQSAGKSAVTDRIVCNLKGPSSSVEFEMFFARDAARTPLLVRVPLSLGRMSMELMH